jgi:hypothetical protein
VCAFLLLTYCGGECFTTGHFLSLNCDRESDRNGTVFVQQVLKQSQSKLEHTAVTAVATMAKAAPAVWLTARTQIHDPEGGSAGGDQQARQTRRV